MTSHPEPLYLSEYLDGEIGGAQKSELEAHLNGCAACANLLDSLRQVKTALSSAPIKAVPRSLRLETERWLEALQAQPKTALSPLAEAVFLAAEAFRNRLRLIVPAATLAAGALAIGLWLRPLSKKMAVRRISYEPLLAAHLDSLPAFPVENTP